MNSSFPLTSGDEVAAGGEAVGGGSPPSRANSSPPRFRIPSEPYEGPDCKEREPRDSQCHGRDRGKWGEGGDSEEGDPEAAEPEAKAPPARSTEAREHGPGRRGEDMRLTVRSSVRGLTFVVGIERACGTSQLGSLGLRRSMTAATGAPPTAHGLLGRMMGCGKEARPWARISGFII